MKIVFDTNVIVAGLVARGLCHELVEVHLPLHEAVRSGVLWEELIGALRDKFGLDHEDLPLIDLYRRHAVWLEPSPLADPVCRDPSDDWVLATALAGEASLIVTGDDDLLSLGSFAEVEIISPRRFLEDYVLQLRSQEARSRLPSGERDPDHDYKAERRKR